MPCAFLDDDPQATVVESCGAQDLRQRLHRRRRAAAAAFAGAHADSDTIGPLPHLPGAIEEDAIAYADRRALEQQAAEDAGPRHRRVECADRAVRRPAEAGMRRP